jgi:hypothetical protein
MDLEAADEEMRLLTSYMERLRPISRTPSHSTIAEKYSVQDCEELTGMAPYIDVDDETDSDDEYEYMPN